MSLDVSLFLLDAAILQVDSIFKVRKSTSILKNSVEFEFLKFNYLT